MISLAIDKADAVIQDEKLKDLHDNLLHVQYYHENYVSTHDFSRSKNTIDTHDCSKDRRPLTIFLVDRIRDLPTNSLS